MSISPAEAAYQLAHANQSRTGELIASTAALSALATALVLARFIIRVHTKVGLKADDWTILVALVRIQPPIPNHDWVADRSLGPCLVRIRGECYM